MSIENEESVPTTSNASVETSTGEGTAESAVTIDLTHTVLNDSKVINSDFTYEIKHIETEVEAELRKTKALLAAVIVKLNNQAQVIKEHAKTLGKEVDTKVMSFVKDDLSVEKIESEFKTSFESLIGKVRGWFSSKPESITTPQPPAATTPVIDSPTHYEGPVGSSGLGNGPTIKVE